MTAMITIREALQIVKNNLPPQRRENIDLAQAQGRALAENIQAAESSPRYTNSAMDGFVVRWEDVRNVSETGPVTLKIVGESQAGVPFLKKLNPGQAARISTGAMLCEGADTIIPVEETEERGKELRVLKANKPQNHIRFRGEEFNAGDLLLQKGVVLHPAQIATLASQGIARAPVYQKPSVSVIVTGSELVPYDSPPKPWQIRDSNGIMLSAAIRHSGGIVRSQIHVGDNFPETVKALRAAMKKSDVILFSGGVSVGPHDLVKKAAAECGFETLFWRVRQKPGKPLFFARNGDILFFGLPGNPVSAYMCYLYYVHPILQWVQGKPFDYKTIPALMAETVINKIDRAQFFRVEIVPQSHQPPLASPLSRQGSHMLTTVTDAGGFILLEVDERIRRDDMVEVIPFV